MVHAKGALAQHDRLDALVGAMAYYVEHIARDTHMAALDHKAREFDKQLEKLIKHAMGQHATPPRRFASAIITVEIRDPRSGTKRVSPSP
jgi:hypothetical protein